MKNIFIIFINENLKVFIFENFESQILRLTPLSLKEFQKSQDLRIPSNGNPKK